MTQSVSEQGDTPSAGASPTRGSWLLLLLLTAISIVSLLDRQVITILAVDIKADLGLSDAEIGLVYGTVFGVSYALFAIPLGRLADGWIRTRQIAASVLTWSLATVASGMSAGFGSLCAMRTVVAAAESGVGPASNSIVADLFPSRLRATALAVLMSAATLGLGLSLLFGGVVMGLWKSAFPDGTGWFGLSAWRATFVAAAIPGLVLAVVVALVREPVRGLTDGTAVAPDRSPLRTALRQLAILLPGISLFAAARTGASRREIGWLAAGIPVIAAGIVAVSLLLNFVTPVDRLRVYGTLLDLPVTIHTIQATIVAVGLYATASWVVFQRRTDRVGFAAMWSRPLYRWLLLLACSQLALAFGMNAFLAPFAIQTYGQGAEVVGPRVGLALMLGGFLGTMAGGFFGDRAFLKSRYGRLWIMLASVVATAPLILVTLRQESLQGFIYCYTAMNFAMAAWYPCCMANVSDIIPASHRATAVAVFNLSFTILGQGLGPYIVGSISDATGSLGTALHWLTLMSVPAALATLLAMLSVRAAAREPAAGVPAPVPP